MNVDPLKTALREAATELTRLALDQGNPPPAEVLPDVARNVDTIQCLNCDEHLLNRAPYRHLATAKTECEETVDTELTEEEKGLFLALMQAMALGYAGLSSPLGLMRTKFDGKDCAVIVGIDQDDEESPLWPIAVLVNQDIVNRLDPPSMEPATVLIPPADPNTEEVLRFVESILRAGEN